jgi:hypothetical protein
MNRDLRRSLQKKTSERKQVSYDLNFQKNYLANVRRSAMAEGMLIGFDLTMQLVKESAKNVDGIGQKRFDALIEQIDLRIKQLKNEAQLNN